MRRFLAATLGLLAIVGSASAQTPEASVQTPPHRLLPLAVALDSAATVERLRRIPSDTGPSGAFIYRVWFSTRTGAVDSVAAIRFGAPPRSGAAAVREALTAGARRVDPSDSAGMLEVVAVPGERPTLREVISSPPRVLNGRDVTRGLTRFTRTYARANPRRHPHAVVVVMMKMRVDAAGIPGAVTVFAPSGDPALNAQALDAAPRLRFSPAILESQPVPVWITVPVIFTFP